jgi:hypothetical protein
MNDPVDPRAPSLRQWLGWSALLVVLSLAAGFAGWERDLSINEIWALIRAGEPLHEQFKAIRYDMVHPPLIYLIERWWLHAFGPTDSAAKFLPLVLNMPTIVLFTWLAIRVTPHWRLASFLFSGSYFHPGSATTQVRMYGLCLCWVVVAILLWERWRREPRLPRLAAWAGVMTLLIYTHYFGLLLLAAFAVVNWFYGPRRWTFTGGATITALAFLPWFLYVLPVYLDRGLGLNLAWVSKEPHVAVAEVPALFLGNVLPSGNLFATTAWLHSWNLRRAEVGAAVLLHLVVLVIAWPAVRRLWSRPAVGEDATHWFRILTLLVSVPVVLLYVFSVAHTPAFNARFITGTLPGYWLLLVLLGQFGGRAGRAVLYGLVLPWAVISTCVAIAESRRPSPIRRAALQIGREVQPADLILCDGSTAAPFYWEWTRRLGRAGRLENLLLASPDHWLSELPKKRLEQLHLKGVDRVWFLTYDEAKLASVPGFLKPQGFVLQSRARDELLTLMCFTRASQT